MGLNETVKSSIQKIIDEYKSMRFSEIEVVTIPKRNKSMCLVKLKINEAQYILEVLAFGKVNERIESLVGVSNLQLSIQFIDY